VAVKKGTSAGRVRRAEILKKRSQKYVLKLYVAGANRKSAEAIRNITEICDEHLKGRYELEIIDIHQRPVMLQGAQIIAAPTLIRKLPLPLRRLIGSMADKGKVLAGLDVRPLS
jgi:circadian clock protein KaiB